MASSVGLTRKNQMKNASLEWSSGRLVGLSPHENQPLYIRPRGENRNVLRMILLSASWSSGRSDQMTGNGKYDGIDITSQEITLSVFKRGTKYR